MSHTPLFEEFAATCADAHRACEGVADARAALQKTRAETEQLIAQARQIHPIGWCASTDDAIMPLPKDDSHEAAYRAVHIIHDILNQFPLHVQVAIVKALGAHAVVLAQLRRGKPPALSA